MCGCTEILAIDWVRISWVDCFPDGFLWLIFICSAVRLSLNGRFCLNCLFDHYAATSPSKFSGVLLTRHRTHLNPGLIQLMLWGGQV